jgi:Ribonuclease G/E
MRRVVIDGQPGEIRIAVLEDEVLADLLIERADRPNPVGSRYLGRVTAFDDGLQAAFVDIGLDRPALLPRKRAMTRLNEGDRIVVEVTRAPSPGKGAKLKQDIPDARETSGRPPRLLTPAAPLSDLLTRHAPADLLVAGEAAMAALRTQAPNFAATATLARPDGDPFHDLGLDAAIDALLAPEVPLGRGGRLWVEPVRTLTAIDVDTGAQASHAGASGLDPAQANLAAIPEIARQIRLRGLSGLLVVDFLEVATKAERTEISAELQTALDEDGVAAEVGPMRPSGLVELSRQRVRWPLHELLLAPAGRGGSGYRLTADTAARELLRAVARESAARAGRPLRVHVAPALGEALDGPVAPAREALAQRLGQPLAVIRDGTLELESWRIEEVAP